MKLKVIVAFLLFGLVTNAQVRNYVKSGSKTNSSIKKKSKKSDENKFTYGLGIGLNMANVADGNVSSSVENVYRFGLNAGINLQYQFTPVVGIKSGLKYSQIGSEYVYSDGSSKLKIDQLQVPIMLNFRVDDNFPKMYFGLGVQNGSLISAKFEDDDFEYKDYFDSSDLQGVLDFDLYFTDKLFLKTGMFVSLSSTVKNDIQEANDLENETNIGLMVSVNYNF
jgi:opacity protein-like surface antigen